LSFYFYTRPWLAPGFVHFFWDGKTVSRVTKVQLFNELTETYFNFYWSLCRAIAAVSKRKPDGKLCMKTVVVRY